MRTKIYVSCPYTVGDRNANIRKACETAEALAKEGFAPYLPHGYEVWDQLEHHPREFWAELVKEFLPACEAVLRVEGESAAVEAEVQIAHSLKIPVFKSVSEVVAHFNKPA